MKQTVFTGAAVAIVTPMYTDGSINYDKLGSLIDWQIAQGTDALVICGTTGESATMTDAEHVEVIRYAVDRTAGRIPVIAGAGSNDTAYAVWLSKEAEAAGADALLHVTPYYNKATQKGLITHFSAIADATPLPVILYNVPSRTGVNMQPATYRELSRISNIVAVKEANGDIASVARTLDLCAGELDVYSGNDDQIVPILSLGGKGVISVLSNIAPAMTHRICEEYFHGNTALAAQMQVDCIALVDALFCEVNPIPVKQALNLMGFACGPCRLPLTEMESANVQRLKEQMIRHGIIAP